MNLLCKGAGVLTFLIVAIYVAAGRTTIFQPGALSATHEWLGSDCPACHRPWSFTRGGAAGCDSASCHVLSRLHRAHGAAPQPACPRCHVEHGALSLASNPIPDDAACLGCHAAKMKKDHPAGKACYKCHFYHGPPRGLALASGRPTGILMNHSVHLISMADILKVKDRQSLCATCHVARPGQYRFAPFTRQGCNRNNENCHAVRKVEGQKKFKDPLREKPVPGFGRPHPGKTLFMHSAHIKKHKCAECHADIEKNRRVTHAPIATPAFCARCHHPEGAGH